MRGDSWRGSSWRLTISTLPGTGVSRQAAAAPDRLLPNATLPLESPPGAEAGSWLERAGRAVAPTGPPTVANDVRGTSLGRAPASRLSLPRCTVSGMNFGNQGDRPAAPQLVPGAKPGGPAAVGAAGGAKVPVGAAAAGAKAPASGVGGPPAFGAAAGAPALFAGAVAPLEGGGGRPVAAGGAVAKLPGTLPGASSGQPAAAPLLVPGAKPGDSAAAAANPSAAAGPAAGGMAGGAKASAPGAAGAAAPINRGGVPGVSPPAAARAGGGLTGPGAAPVPASGSPVDARKPPGRGVMSMSSLTGDPAAAQAGRPPGQGAQLAAAGPSSGVVLWEQSEVLDKVVFDRAQAKTNGTNFSKSEGGTYPDKRSLLTVLNSPSPLCTIVIPTEHVCTTNRAMQESQLWGTDIYSSDSDLVCVLVHMGFIDIGAEPPAKVKELVVTLRVTPPLLTYLPSTRCGIRSRNRPGDQDQGRPGCSFVVESCVQKLTGDMSDEVLFPTTHIFQQPLRVSRPRVQGGARYCLPNLTIVYDLSMDPCFKYSLPMVMDIFETVEYDDEEEEADQKSKDKAKSKFKNTKGKSVKKIGGTDSKEAGKGDVKKEGEDSSETEQGSDKKSEGGTNDDEAKPAVGAGAEKGETPSAENSTDTQDDSMEVDDEGADAPENEEIARLALSNLPDVTIETAHLTSTRMQTECIFVDTFTDRYEIAQEEVSDTKNLTYRVSKIVDPMGLDQAAVTRNVVPLKAEHATVIHSSLKWRQIKWGPTGVRFCDDAPLTLSCLRFVSRTASVLNSSAKSGEANKVLSRAALMKKQKMKTGVFKTKRYGDESRTKIKPIDSGLEDDNDSESYSPKDGGPEDELVKLKPKLKAKAAGKVMDDEANEDDDAAEDEDSYDTSGRSEDHGEVDGMDGDKDLDDDEKRGRAGRPKPGRPGRGPGKVGKGGKGKKDSDEGESVEEGDFGPDEARKRKRIAGELSADEKPLLDDEARSDKKQNVGSDTDGADMNVAESGDLSASNASDSDPLGKSAIDGGVGLDDGSFAEENAPERSSRHRGAKIKATEKVKSEPKGGAADQQRDKQLRASARTSGKRTRGTTKESDGSAADVEGADEKKEVEPAPAAVVTEQLQPPPGGGAQPGAKPGGRSGRNKRQRS